jgi:hypothetical protein
MSCTLDDGFFSCNIVTKFSKGDMLKVCYFVALMTLSFLSNIKENIEIHLKDFHQNQIVLFSAKNNQDVLYTLESGN